MPEPNSFPCRLHVLLARDAPRAVVIRRGPSKRVCTVGWNRENDTFTIGQWLKGRIYERRCDLSPDARHFLYFAMDGHRETRVNGSWTGLSRAPYLKALGLWAKGDGWHGGGLFVDGKTYWINDGYGHTLLENPAGLTRVQENPFEHYPNGECLGVYYPRLMRDGWKLKNKIEHDKHESVTTFEKRINDQWMLRKFAYATLNHPPGKGCYYDRHEIKHSRTGEKIDGAEWEWADVDRHRLVWAQAGKLFAGRLGNKAMSRVVELYDFNAMIYERLKAPY